MLLFGGLHRLKHRQQRLQPLLRVHAGLEDPDDLIADLERGFARLAAHG